MIIKVDWDGCWWISVEGESIDDKQPCPEWLSQNAPDAWVERLVRESFVLEPDDTIEIDRNMR